METLYHIHVLFLSYSAYWAVEWSAPLSRQKWILHWGQKKLERSYIVVESCKPSKPFEWSEILFHASNGLVLRVKSIVKTGTFANKCTVRVQ